MSTCPRLCASLTHFLSASCYPLSHWQEEISLTRMEPVSSKLWGLSARPAKYMIVMSLEQLAIHPRQTSHSKFSVSNVDQQVESLSTAESSMTKTLNWSTKERESCPWPMLDLEPTVLNSLFALLTLLGWMESTLSSERLSVSLFTGNGMSCWRMHIVFWVCLALSTDIFRDQSNRPTLEKLDNPLPPNNQQMALMSWIRLKWLDPRVELPPKLWLWRRAARSLIKLVGDDE